jgi:hypothetical protein
VAIICMSCSIQIIVMFNSCLMRRMKRRDRFLAVEAGRRLVEHGLERKRAGKANNLLRQQQAADGGVAIALQLDELDDALDRLAMRSARRTPAKQSRHRLCGCA